MNISRPIWTEFLKSYVEAIGFVPRCSRCGHFPKKTLLKHWFFRGFYCHRCVQGVLFDNARNVGEVNNAYKSVRYF